MLQCFLSYIFSSPKPLLRSHNCIIDFPITFRYVEAEERLRTTIQPLKHFVFPLLKCLSRKPPMSSLLHGILGFILLVFYSWTAGWKLLRRDVSSSASFWLSLCGVGLLERTDRRGGTSHHSWVHHDDRNILQGRVNDSC